MPRQKFVHTGGQTKTILCKCGFRARGSERDVNYKYKLHQTKCESCKMSNPSLNIIKDTFINTDTCKQVEIRTFKN
jgi:hypothetical protein